MNKPKGWWTPSEEPQERGTMVIEQNVYMTWEDNVNHVLTVTRFDGDEMLSSPVVWVKHPTELGRMLYWVIDHKVANHFSYRNGYSPRYSVHTWHNTEEHYFTNDRDDAVKEFKRRSGL